MKLLEKHFWAFCVAATLLGLLVPWTGWPFRTVSISLMGILFFGGLKIDFSSAAKEFRRPGFLVYLVVMFMVVMPLGVWLAARWLAPEFALGLLVLAAMPAGVVCSSLTEIAGGNSALALVGTLSTTLLCPIIAPLVISLHTGELAAGGFFTLARQSAYMAVILFVPLTAAWLVRRHWPSAVARHRQAFTGISIIFLLMVILGSMSISSEATMEMVRSNPAKIVALMACLCGLSAVLHVAGYWLAPWRPSADRAALSINAAYVNNGLGIVFAKTFFVSNPLFGVAAMLPSVLLEIPMTLAILPVRWHLARKIARPATPAAGVPA